MAQDIPVDIPIYEHISTFLGVPPVADFQASDAEIIIQGIPFDMATPGRPGTRYGPTGIRTASSNLRWDTPRWPWTFDLRQELRIEDAGDMRLQTGFPETMLKVVENQTQEILTSGKRVLSFGGDHYVSLPLLRSYYKKYGKMALLHFDAHTDTYDGPEFDNGTMFHYAVKEGLIEPEWSVQIGIRTAYIKEGYRFTVLDADWVANHGPEMALKEIQKVIGDRSVYLSFDIDSLDPAFAPGTGTPVAGGFSTNFALQVIRGLTDVNVVGMDLVEVSPPYDHSEITALAGATISLEMLHVWAQQKLVGLFQ